ncbi:MAG TPA: class I SAM-dependent methyltransferase [Rhodothermales bacterium]|nr:class I SAM-dependent methyltransferase [Rhodothermales bacterium]
MDSEKRSHFYLYRIPTVTRITLERELKKQFARLKQRGGGRVLDVGAKQAPYVEDIAATTYLTLDIDKSCNPDLCCDLHDVEWTSEYFDTIIATEVLEHLYDPQQALREMHRLLKPGGICLLSTRFIYEYHADPNDYFRFTEDSLAYLLRDFSRVEIYPHGNRWQAIWQLLAGSKRTLGLLSWLNPLVARIKQKETRCPLGFVVWAER